MSSDDPVAAQHRRFCESAEQHGKALSAKSAVPPKNGCATRVPPEHARLSTVQPVLLGLRFLVVQRLIPLGRVPGELGR